MAAMKPNQTGNRCFQNFTSDNDKAKAMRSMGFGIVVSHLEDDFARGNAKLPYLLQNAGVAVGYGLTKEQALSAITLSTAKILGIDNRTGSLETGKDANIIVSDGDLLDIKNSNIIYAFIQGREINLNNKQKQLYECYKTKYGITK